MKKVKRETKPNHTWLWISLPTALIVLAYLGFRVSAGDDDKNGKQALAHWEMALYLEKQNDPVLNQNNINKYRAKAIALCPKIEQAYARYQAGLALINRVAPLIQAQREMIAANALAPGITELSNGPKLAEFYKASAEAKRAEKAFDATQKPRAGAREQNY